MNSLKLMLFLWCLGVLGSCSSPTQNERFSYGDWNVIAGTPVSWRLEVQYYLPKQRRERVWLRNDSAKKLNVRGVVHWNEITTYNSNSFPHEHAFEVELEPGGTIRDVEGRSNMYDHSDLLKQDYSVIITNIKEIP